MGEHALYVGLAYGLFALMAVWLIGYPCYRTRQFWQKQLQKKNDAAS